jgi:hypothetical protein
MRARLLLVLLVLVPAVTAQEKREVAGPSTSVATKGTIRKTLDRDGTFVPADAAEIRLDLESWRGELTVAEAVPHGSFVNEGDVVMRLDTQTKMYAEDELVDATEEIVLKRSRRNYAQSQAWNSLSEQRRVYDKDWYYPWREEDLVVEADNKTRELERVKRSQAMAREKSDSELEKTRYELAQQKKRFEELKRDRERFQIRSPRRGILLHGAPDDAPWGRIEKGSALKNRSVVACVADPKKMKVATTIAEADILKIKTGTAVEIVPTASEDAKMIGRLEVEYLPQKGNVYKAAVQLGQVDLRVRPGFACKAVVILEEERDAILVPKTALIERDGGKVIRCAKTEGGPFEERVVVVGICDGKNVVIREGVEAGEVVAVEQAKAK